MRGEIHTMTDRNAFFSCSSSSRSHKRRFNELFDSSPQSAAKAHKNDEAIKKKHMDGIIPLSLGSIDLST
jgi:hypothetical protein